MTFLKLLLVVVMLLALPISCRVVAQEIQSDIELHWTASGDDGTLGGAAALYDLRYTTTPSAVFSSWIEIDGEPVPGEPGTTDSIDVRLTLFVDSTYHLSLIHI